MRAKNNQDPIERIRTKEPEDEDFEDSKQRLETPEKVYYLGCKIARKLGLYPPEIDLMASKSNSKCNDFIDRKQDFFKTKPLLSDGSVPDTCFVNASHKIYQYVVPRLHDHYLEYDFNIIALMPSNTERTDYFTNYIERYRMDCVEGGHIFYFPINMRIPFELDGKQATDKNGKPDVARDAYKFVFWVGKTHLKKFKEKIPEFYRWYFSENEEGGL